MAQKLINITGNRFGELLVLGLLRGPDTKHYLWLCLCTCGKTSRVNGTKLRAGLTISCGHRAFVHGHAKPPTRTYRIWAGMLHRCSDPTHEYARRGIRVCLRWYAFPNFLADVGACPGDEYSLDRYPDNDGNYEPGNVRWATAQEQANNTRQNHLVSYQNRTQTLAQWARELNKPYHVVESRLRAKWPVERAFTEDVHYKDEVLSRDKRNGRFC